MAPAEADEPLKSAPAPPPSMVTLIGGIGLGVVMLLALLGSLTLGSLLVFSWVSG